MSQSDSIAVSHVQAKVVYWGPAEVGKTTSIMRVRDAFARYCLDQVIMVQTTGGRTLWNEYGAFEFTIPRKGGTTTRAVVHVSSLTGQERFLQTREFAGASADGVIFVADCRQGREGVTRLSYEELVAFALPSAPVVVQANWQDAEGAMNPGELEALLDSVQRGRHSCIIPTVASTGANVATAFLEAVLRVLVGRR